MILKSVPLQKIIDAILREFLKTFTISLRYPKSTWASSQGSLVTGICQIIHTHIIKYTKFGENTSTKLTAEKFEFVNVGRTKLNDHAAIPFIKVSTNPTILFRILSPMVLR